MSDDRLRALYDRALADREATGADGAHLSPDELLALARREPPEARGLALLDHVMACATCAREFELLRAIEGAGDATPARVTRIGRPGPWRRAVPVLLAASVVVAVGVGAYDRLRDNDDVMRGGGSGLALVAPADGERVAPPVRLVWRSAPDAGSYRVEVLGADAVVAFTTVTADTSVVVPASAPLVPGADYEWWVRAIGGTGPSRSEVAGFRLRTE